MENLVPLGTGNSRFMKSNISPDTSLAQLIQMLNNGTFPYDVGSINPAGISQQGTPLNKATLLSDETAQKYGYTGDQLPGVVPDGVFLQLISLILSGKYAFRVPVQLSDGTPVVGCPVVGLTSFADPSQPAVTGEDGTAVGYTETGSASFSIASYLDIASSTSVSASGVRNQITGTSPIVMTPKNFLDLRASASGMFSAAMTRLDVSIVSAGAGGGSGVQRGSGRVGGRGGSVGSASGGSGGNGYAGGGGGGGGSGASGGVIVRENVNFIPDTNYVFTVGKGGAGGDWTDYPGDGADGGTSSALSMTADGIVGSRGYNGTGQSASPTESGSGGTAPTSPTKIYSGFTETKSVGTGGIGSEGTTGYVEAQAGGDGGYPGGGGGGSGGYVNSGTGNGGDGADGEITMRMWHGEEAA